MRPLRPSSQSGADSNDASHSDTIRPSEPSPPVSTYSPPLRLPCAVRRFTTTLPTCLACDMVRNAAGAAPSVYASCGSGATSPCASTHASGCKHCRLLAATGRKSVASIWYDTSWRSISIT